MPKRPYLERRKARPLNAESLRELALAYLGRFATSRAKLTRYLNHKLSERGWDGSTLPEIESLVADMAAHGFVDDASYAEMQARSLTRRGYGHRRVSAAAFAAGIANSDRGRANIIVEQNRVEAALRFAQKRRWGPYADVFATDPALRKKMIAAFMRAGHDPQLAQKILTLKPGDEIDQIEQ